VIDEIEYLVRQFQLDEVGFADDAFTLDRDLVLELCGLSRARSLDWRWKCGTRVDLVDGELLERMHEAGCYRITYGVEAGSQEILDAIGKKITLEQAKRAVAMTLEAGIDVVCAFMFPHPDDTEETVRRQKQFMKELQAMGVTETLSSTTPFPGTYYYDHRDRLGLKILASTWDEYDGKHVMISTRNFSAARLSTLQAELVQDLNLKPGD
jgi:radical SAM superfamily enzyme YgiQ (UPF0313 family)